MSRRLTRRNLIRYGAQMLSPPLLEGIAGCSPDLPSGKSEPHKPFDRHSTAEEVTVGLDLTGKTALVTGCHSGIGREILRVLVLRGAHVLALARTREKAEEACVSVLVPGARGHTPPFACEQTDFGSVVACSDAVSGLGIPLDILVCNARVNLQTLELSNGLEKNFVVNHLSHFILVNRLLGRLTAAAQGRVVVIGSMAYLYAPAGGIDFDNLDGRKRPYAPTQLYGQSKLANGLFALELARRLTDTRATANIVHPGVVDTKMNWTWNANMPLYWRLYGWLLGLSFQMKTVAEGSAATPCYVATSPSLSHTSGAYFEDCHIEMPRGYMRDTDLAARLWQVSEELTQPYLGRP